MIVMLRRLTLAAFLAVLGATAAQPAQAREPAFGVLFVGIAGLAWQDVTAEDTPTLYSLVGPNAAASLTVRTVRPRTCVVDGWLTLGAGRRATDVPDLDADEAPDRFCRALPEPIQLAGGEAAAVPGWDLLVAVQEGQTYDTQLGLLGDRIAGTGFCATSVGPGAALALAQSDGVAAKYIPDPAAVDEELLGDCPVTVVDLGSLPPPGEPGDEEAEQAAVEDRRSAASAVDTALQRLLQNVPDNVAVLVAGIADSAPGDPPAEDEPSTIAPSALRLALAAGPQPDSSEYGPNWLSSPSTRWTGLVQLTDVASTLAAYAGVEDPSAGTVGRPWRTVGPHPGSAQETIDQLVGTDRATQVFRTQSGPFFQILGVAEVLFFGGAVLWLRRHPAGRRRLIRLVQYAALGAASFPVASFLANLSRWWRFERAGTMLWTTILVITVVVTILALRGPWRRRIYGPPGVVAGLTAVVLAVDVSTGSNLQHASLLGLSPLVAGRFYGFGNIPYAIFVASALVAAAALAQLLLDRGHSRRTAAFAAALIGVAAIVVDGAPQAGADVGGILATVPGFAVLVLCVAGVRVTAWRMVLAGALAVGVVVLIGWLDWLRPVADRTHFGEFFADVVDGDAWPVVWRKAQASIGTLQRSPYYGWLVPVAYGVIIWLVRAPGVSGVQAAVARWPLLRPLIWAGLVTGATGFAVNDSGIIVPGLLLTVGIPLVVSAIADAQLAESDPESTPVAAAPEQRPAIADPGAPENASPPR
jgi:hypothetical protein